MSEKFTFAYAFTKKWEGGWSDHPADKGGPTNYGLTLATMRDDYSKRDPAFFREIGVSLPITKAVLKAMTPAQAEATFERFYWQPHDLDDYSDKVSAFMFDAGVNHGWSNAVKIAQRAYNDVCPKSQRIQEDGICGTMTRVALHTTGDAFVKALCDRRERFYRSIAVGSQKVFLQGWLNRLNDERKYLRVA